ncbi:hypothetical protein [Kineosporia babensis]
MAKKNVTMFGVTSKSLTMRAWTHNQSFSKQHEIGIRLLRHCGVNI